MHTHVKPNILHQPTKFYQIPGESDDEEEPVWNKVPMGGIQAPTSNTDPLMPSMATPEPEPELWKSNCMVNRGTRPDYWQLHNQSTWDQLMFTCEKEIQLVKTKQSMVANKNTKAGNIIPRH